MPWRGIGRIQRSKKRSNRCGNSQDTRVLSVFGGTYVALRVSHRPDGWPGRGRGGGAVGSNEAWKAWRWAPEFVRNVVFGRQPEVSHVVVAWRERCHDAEEDSAHLLGSSKRRSNRDPGNGIHFIIVGGSCARFSSGTTTTTIAQLQ